MADTPPLRVLVVDDEPLARQRILDLLDRLSDVTVVGTAANGRGAIASIEKEAPDLVFLDVQMPGLTGLDVVRTVGPDAMPLTVFTTAYDAYALAAFDLAALDYLLKPFEDDRFFAALDRARSALRLRDADRLRHQLLALLNADGSAPSNESAQAGGLTSYLERIAVESRGQVRVVPVGRITYFAADGPYVEVHTVGSDGASGETHVIRERMQALEEQLDPEAFFRIHRSTIVRLDRVEALLKGGGGDYAVRLTDGTRLRVSRRRRDALAERLGLPNG